MQRDFLNIYASSLEQDIVQLKAGGLRQKYAPERVCEELLSHKICRAMTDYIERSLIKREFVSMYLIISMCKRHLYQSNSPTIFPIATDETKQTWNQVKQFTPDEARSMVKICRALEKIHGNLPS